jgi:GNAT superfamily N-acetyltransferase
MRIEIRQNPADVCLFLDAIQSSADENREALGFLPVQAYQSAAAARKLFVAVAPDQNDRFCGYVLFGGTFPHARIFQVFVPPRLRSSGVGAQLVQAVVDVAEASGYMSASAKVADDLEANAFWEQLRFLTARRKPGGATRNRTINVRVRLLSTPTLFGYPEGERVSHLPLTRAADRPAVYLVDLNVFFDVVKRRPRAELAGRVFGAGLSNLVRIVVAEEFANELRRTSKPAPTDPILELAMQLPTLPVPHNPVLGKLTDELARIVFPGRLETLTAQDKSDLTHLATAVYHSATGFVTSEKAMVAAHGKIQAQYGVRIVDVEKFGESVQIADTRPSGFHARLGANSLRLSELTPELKPALARLFDSGEIAEEFAASNRHSLIALLDDVAVAAITWSCRDPLERVFSGTIAADEEHPAVETALDAVLYRFSREATRAGVALLRLAIPPGQVITSQIAEEQGFRPVREDSTAQHIMERVAVGGAVAPDDWETVRSAVERLCSMRFPVQLPQFTLYDARLNFELQDGTKQVIGLFDLESTMAPSCFILPGRPGVIVPIQPRYSVHLLGTSKQLSLLPTHGAVAFHQRVYYSAARNARLLLGGTAVVFYESAGGGKGRSAAVALARVVSTSVVSKGDVPGSRIDRGVLDKEGVRRITTRDKVAVTTFDNVIKFEVPVPMKQLRAIGCVDGANLVSAKRISSEHLETIIRKGTKRGRG